MELLGLLVILGYFLWPIIGGLAIAPKEPGKRSVYTDVFRGAFWGACLCSVTLLVLAIAVPLAYGNWLAYLVCVAGLGPVLGGLPGAAIARNNFDQRRWDEAASGKKYLKPWQDEARPQPFQFGLSSLFVLMTIVAVVCGLTASAPDAAAFCYGVLYAFGPCVVLALTLFWPRIPRRNRKTLGLILTVLVALPAIVWCAIEGGASGVLVLLITTACWWGVQTAVLAAAFYSLRPPLPLAKAPPSYPVACACGRQVEILAVLAGMEIACPECGTMLQVPPLAELEGRAM